MTSSSNRVLDDVAKLLTDVAGAAQGVRQEAETALRAQIEKVLNNLDLVQREDFEVVKEIAIKSLNENQELKKRIEVLEKQMTTSKKTDLKK